MPCLHWYVYQLQVISCQNIVSTNLNLSTVVDGKAQFCQGHVELIHGCQVLATFSVMMLAWMLVLQDNCGCQKGVSLL